MKLSSRLQQLRLKHEKSARQAEAKPVPREPRLARSTWVVIGLCALLAALGPLAVLEFFVWNKIPPALVGLWELREGPQKVSTFEFFRNGNMEVHQRIQKREVTRKMSGSVQGKTLRITAKDPRTGNDVTSESIIRELTADTLILEERGEVLRMVRIE
jgi:hypothetical protein